MGSAEGRVEAVQRRAQRAVDRVNRTVALGGGQFVLVGNIIESQFLTSGDWNFGSAISLIMAIIIMLSMWLTRKVDVQPASRGKE